MYFWKAPIAAGTVKWKKNCQQKQTEAGFPPQWLSSSNVHSFHPWLIMLLHLCSAPQGRKVQKWAMNSSVQWTSIPSQEDDWQQGNKTDGQQNVGEKDKNGKVPRWWTRSLGKKTLAERRQPGVEETKGAGHPAGRIHPILVGEPGELGLSLPMIAAGCASSPRRCPFCVCNPNSEMDVRRTKKFQIPPPGARQIAAFCCLNGDDWTGGLVFTF